MAAMPSSVPPSVYLFIDAIPTLSSCANRKSASCLSIWTAMIQGLRLCVKPMVPRRSAATYLRHVLCWSLSGLCVISVSVCHLEVCFSGPYALVSLRVRALVFVCSCVVTPSVLRRLCRSLPGLLSSSEGRGGIKKTDPQQIPFLSLTHCPQSPIFISCTQMPPVIWEGKKMEIVFEISSSGGNVFSATVGLVWFVDQ